jgi:iron uptake system component EfeO
MGPYADQLLADVQQVVERADEVTLDPLQLANGAKELLDEIATGKITGEEDRYSHTDLWDFDANLQGSQAAIDKLSPALSEADPALLGKIDAGLTQLFDTMRPLRRGDGWVLFCTPNDKFPSPRCPQVTVDQATIDKLKAELADLSENLSQVSGVLKLQ